MARGWQAARLSEVPSSAEIPVPGRALAPGEELEELRERDPAAVARWEEFGRLWPDSDRRTHAVRRYFGLSAFGCNAFSASAGSPLVVPHDETAYGQEELYLVLEGRARFVVDGEELELGSCELLYAGPEVTREAHALETPTTIFLVGGIPGEPYTPPTWSRDAPTGL